MKKYFPYDITGSVAIEGEEHTIVHGQKVYVSYRAVASPVTADDMNEFESRLTGAEKRLNSHETTFNDTTLLINNVRDNLTVELSKHTTNVAAHSDIRDSLTAETRARTNGDASLQNQISATNRNLTAEITARIRADETFTSNISSLRSVLSTEMINRINGDNALDNRIDTLGGALATEISNRTNADSGLQTQIKALAVAFTGATSIAGGTSGLIPTPSAGDESKFLRGDGTWDVSGTDSFVPRTSSTAFTIAISPSIAATANVCAAGETMAGKIRINAKTTPTDSISGEYLITKGAA